MERVRQRLRPFACTVREVVRETPDTVTLYLDPGAEPKDYLPGQFVSVEPGQFRALQQVLTYLEHEKGRRELVRAYSLASIPEDPYLAVTIKEEVFVPGRTEYPPLVSPMLVHGVSPGTRLEVRGFSGPYVLPPDVERRTDHLVHVVAGSGVVPNFAIVRWALRHLPRVRHTFIYSNRTLADVIFSEQLARLERESGGRLQLHHCFTRETGDVPGAHRGRIDLPLLRRLVPDPGACLVYACGPALTRWEKKTAKERGEEPAPRFLEAATAMLAELGVPKQNLTTEAYG